MKYGGMVCKQLDILSSKDISFFGSKWYMKGSAELLRRMRGAQGKGSLRDTSLDHIHQSAWILSSELALAFRYFHFNFLIKGKLELRD